MKKLIIGLFVTLLLPIKINTIFPQQTTTDLKQQSPILTFLEDINSSISSLNKETPIITKRKLIRKLNACYVGTALMTKEEIEEFIILLKTVLQNQYLFKPKKEKEKEEKTGFYRTKIIDKQKNKIIEWVKSLTKKIENYEKPPKISSILKNIKETSNPLERITFLKKAIQIYLATVALRRYLRHAIPLPKYKNRIKVYVESIYNKYENLDKEAQKKFKDLLIQLSNNLYSSSLYSKRQLQKKIANVKVIYALNQLKDATEINDQIKLLQEAIAYINKTIPYRTIAKTSIALKNFFTDIEKLKAIFKTKGEKQEALQRLIQLWNLKKEFFYMQSRKVIDNSIREIIS